MVIFERIFIRLLLMIPPLCVSALQCSTVEASTRAPCSEEQLLRAVSSERRIKLSIENIYSTPVTVYVLNDAGKRFDMAKIEAGHTIEFETFDTFPVVVADSDGRCLEITGEHLNTDVAEFPPPPETSDVAIQLLALAFKCPLPIRTIPNPYDGKKDGYWHEARQARLLGSIEQLSFRFKKQQYLSVSDGIHDRYRTLDESLSVFPIDINEVKVNGSVVSLRCLANQQCIDDEITYDANGDNREFKRDKLTSTNLRFCDEAAALDAGAALRDILHLGE